MNCNSSSNLPPCYLLATFLLPPYYHLTTFLLSPYYPLTIPLLSAYFNSYFLLSQNFHNI